MKIIAILILVAGFIQGQRLTSVSEVRTESWPDGGKPVAIDCYKVTALDLEARKYVAVIECVPECSKLDIKSATVLKREVFENGQEGGFECACSTGKDCELYSSPSRVTEADGGWAPATLGNTIDPGKFRGAGCFRKNCIENAGDVIWPSECPQQ